MASGRGTSSSANPKAVVSRSFWKARGLIRSPQNLLNPVRNPPPPRKLSRSSFTKPPSMARLLSLMEDVATKTGGLSSTAGAGASRLGRWVAKEDDDAVYLKVPMPGLTKEHVKVRADKNILVIEGEGEKQPWDGDDDSAVPKYNRRIEMPAADAYKMDKIKAEMKNGVLWVTLLKVKEEERTDVFHVKVE
ncbi:26.2 kDa heat shock protein, mitochondrial-like [Triticum dicoccoides]|uniref:26.2 kDa heat shock protein, mitochondrial-like n=1 Tax=Triticum dicoccoides TaxID=85692 RepID=UPI001891A10A|nr:26.2 kDa heat shock protein, mitochondrial-like [Triticum dicoccoides]XP_044431884.1 26.2 kDa heat shock protein, mitochondrial-like [Triticum aestivum]